MQQHPLKQKEEDQSINSSSINSSSSSHHRSLIIITHHTIHPHLDPTTPTAHHLPMVVNTSLHGPNLQTRLKVPTNSHPGVEGGVSNSSEQGTNGMVFNVPEVGPS